MKWERKSSFIWSHIDRFKRALYSVWKYFTHHRLASFKKKHKKTFYIDTIAYNIQIEKYKKSVFKRVINLLTKRFIN